ncbi:MAG: hypothetical protein ACYC26_11230 [Phycisphaerales bacterium]
MRIIRYKQTEWLMPWKWRKKNPLHLFILDIPYAIYHGVAPSREALNEILARGAVGGGMGTGLIWEPLELAADEYEEVLSAWKELEQLDHRKVLKIRKHLYPYLNFVFDPEIMAISGHSDYIKRSREKYSQQKLCM